MAASPKKAPGNVAPRFGKGQPAHYCGKPGKSGPKAGNTNAIRHGLKGSKLPTECKYIEHGVNALRRQLETALMDLRGEVTIVDAAHVNTACKWERHSRLAAHWLRRQTGKLSPTDVLKFSEAIARASDNRDRAIVALGLDAPPKPLDLHTYLQQDRSNGDEAYDS